MFSCIGFVFVLTGLLNQYVCIAADQPPPVDLFQTGTNEWYLAFRGTAFIKSSVYDAYFQGSDNVAAGCKQTSDIGQACSQHYRSPILDKWKDIEEVAFVAVKTGVVQKYAIFNGVGSDNTNWFSESRLKASNWADLNRQHPQIFRISGDDSLERRFFINHNYQGCDHDAGWFVAADDSDPACGWEREEAFPVFIYAAGDSYENWSRGNTAKADVIAVYVKYREVEELSFVDIFGAGEPEYRLVFRGTAHNNRSVYDGYRFGSQNVDAACKQTNGDIPCTSHYRSSILDYWRNIDEVVFAVYRHGKMQQHVIFDGAGSTSVNWFSEAKVRSGSWTDIKGNADIFSISGDDGQDRRFFINHQYGGCPGDEGWFIAVDKHDQMCGWEWSKTYPLFLYSTSSHYVNWNSAEITEADVIAVFVKYGVQSPIIG